MLALFILLAELIGATVSLVWITSMLGFADEAHRGDKASTMGKAYAGACMLLAFAPLTLTIWMGWKYFFCTSWNQVPMGWWLHVVVSLICFPLCWMLIHLYDASYKNRL